MTTRRQRQTLRLLREAFSNADSIETCDQTEHTGRVLVTMSQVSSDYKTRRHNKFAVGPRGGLYVTKQEFFVYD